MHWIIALISFLYSHQIAYSGEICDSQSLQTKAVLGQIIRSDIKESTPREKVDALISVYVKKMMAQKMVGVDCKFSFTIKRKNYPRNSIYGLRRSSKARPPDIIVNISNVNNFCMGINNSSYPYISRLDFLYPHVTQKIYSDEKLYLNQPWFLMKCFNRKGEHNGKYIHN